MGDSTAISTTTQDPNNNTLFDGAEVVSQVTGSSALKKSKEKLFSCDSELHYVDKTLDFFEDQDNSHFLMHFHLEISHNQHNIVLHTL